MALAIDGSTPAIVTQPSTSVATVTTASFTPPSGAVLLVLWAGDSSGTPTQPTITDNLGTPLTYTITDWQSAANPPTVQGQAAAWTATVAVSAPMTITVTSGNVSGARDSALCVLVITGADTATPVGAHGKSGSGSAATIAQSYTAQASGGQGFIGVSDFNALGAETAGTGCTLIGSASIGSSISYGFVRRTSADDVNGNSNTLNVNLPGTSTNLAWVYVEIKPAPVGAAAAGQPPIMPPLDILLQLIAAQQAQGASPAGIPPLTQTDLAGLTDTFVIEQDKVVTDDSGLTDTVALTQSKVVTDDTGLTDTATAQLLKLVTQTDDTGLTDTVVLEQDKVITDQAGLTDTTAVSQAKTATDDTGLTDTSTLVLAKVVTTTDDTGLTDTTAFSATHTITDDAGLTDTTAITRSVVVTDSAGLTDTTTVAPTHAVSATDQAGLTDTATTTATYAPTQTDNTGLTDTFTTVGGSTAQPPRYGIDGTGDATVTDGTATGPTTDQGVHSTGDIATPTHGGTTDGTVTATGAFT